MVRSWLRALTAIGFSLLAPSVGSQQVRPAYDPHTEEALKRGREASVAGKYEDAIKSFKEANKLQHNVCFDCHLGLAEVYSASGDDRSAVDNSNKALAEAADSHRRALAHTMKGLVLMRLAAGDAKRLAAAEEEFRQALTEDKESLEARLDLGVVLLKEMKDEEGKRELQSYLSLVPTGPDAAPARCPRPPRRRSR